MKISENGINLIKEFEGCKLQAYDDGTGTYTIGYGHIRGVKKGQTIPQSLADYYLQEDIIRYENGVKKSSFVEAVSESEALEIAWSLGYEDVYVREA